MKKGWLALCTAALLLLPSAAFAETDESEVTVTGNGLQMTQTQPRFADVTLNVKSTQTSQASNDLYVMDARGTAAGWGITLRATDFKLTRIIDGAAVDFVIPASAVSYTATYKGALAGTAIDFAQGKGELAAAKVLSSTDERIVGVIPSEGAGTHQIGVAYHLAVPKSLTGSNGKTVGLLQGTYTATWTYTATAGI
ncbi:hypothetical protein KIH86_08420 [Paenibacillus sp. HN-1]|uniref:hypothetical protein n=1 Tax=Paenibacillus TaxID=44249 RepID=UPI001CA8335B|nr:MULTISPECIES: hypothetical protein [Paenibacillus]MBY9079574.1 hypothetical protein [Paenibacillus sp. CGMCC 1.18879]MBY9084263.1 hypothetical protein [Paenibacillus sinensis]